MVELRSSVIGLEKPEVRLYKNPHCCLAGKDFSSGELKLPFVSMSVATDHGARSVWVGEYGKVDCWLSPQFTYASEAHPQEFLIPAWYVETSKDSKMINMKVKWTEHKGREGWISLPYLTNTKVLKRYDRLYRAATEHGSAPPNVTKRIEERKRKAPAA